MNINLAYGRLCNLCLCIYSTYKFCELYNLDINDIKYITCPHWRVNFFKINCDFFKKFLENKEIVIDNAIRDDGKTYINFANAKYFDKNYIDEQLYLNRKHNINNCTFYKFLGHGYDYFTEDKYDVQLLKKIFVDSNTNIIDNLSKKYYFLDKKYKKLAIHIRRTDFSSNFMFKDYEINKIIDDNVNDYEFIVIFSDDIDWCKNNIKNKDDKIIFMENNKCYEDLLAMSMCDEVIPTKHSTFSGMAKLMG